MPAVDPQLSRRRLGLIGLGLVAGAAGCTANSPTAGESRRRSNSPSPSPRSTPSRPSTPGPRQVTHPAPALPKVTGWIPGPGEVQPEVKRRAVRVIEAIGSWHHGGGVRAAADRVAALGEDRRLAGQATQLLGSGDQAVVEVIDAQYGGILSASASVLVVCRQWRATSRSVTAGGTTVDVRVNLTSTGWRVTALHPARPGRPEHPSRLAAAVLASHRIQLPPASVADVRSGHVHESVLAAMLELAKRYRIEISVIRSGHPIFVFGTDRRSDHPRGRAFDTWRIDGHPVVDPATPERLITRYMRDAAAAGSYNVGGPYLLPGAGDQFFSDATHHDHVHAGFLA